MRTELRLPLPAKRAPIAPRAPVADYWVARGFAVVVVDARGTGASTGVSRCPYAPEEIEDYGEVANWVAEQWWSNGHVGAVGLSYEAPTAQLLTAPGVRAMKAVVSRYPRSSRHGVAGGVAAFGFLQLSLVRRRLVGSVQPSRFGIVPGVRRLAFGLFLPLHQSGRE
jgi:putative CocE/NonD family hydrolase